MENELIKNWEAFKNFREEKREKNLKSIEYSEAQECLRLSLETIPKNDNIFSIYLWDIHEMFWRVALMKRTHAENAGIPPETLEGMMDWIVSKRNELNLIKEND